MINAPQPIATASPELTTYAADVQRWAILLQAEYEARIKELEKRLAAAGIA